MKIDFEELAASRLFIEDTEYVQHFMHFTHIMRVMRVDYVDHVNHAIARGRKREKTSRQLGPANPSVAVPPKCRERPSGVPNTHRSKGGVTNISRSPDVGQVTNISSRSRGLWPQQHRQLHSTIAFPRQPRRWKPSPGTVNQHIAQIRPNRFGRSASINDTVMRWITLGQC
jgi:hypothetical protein